MRLSPVDVHKDNSMFDYRDALRELKYCGYDVPTRREITNEIIRFYAWLCRRAVSMLETKEKEIERLKSEKANTIERIESEIQRLHKESKCAHDSEGRLTYEWLINGYQSALDMIKDKIEPDCPYVTNGKCIGKNACDLEERCVFKKGGEQE